MLLNIIIDDDVHQLIDEIKKITRYNEIEIIERALTFYADHVRKPSKSFEDREITEWM